MARLAMMEITTTDYINPRKAGQMSGMKVTLMVEVVRIRTAIMSTPDTTQMII
jgi:hypothetical protein